MQCVICRKIPAPNNFKKLIDRLCMSNLRSPKQKLWDFGSVISESGQVTFGGGSRPGCHVLAVLKGKREVLFSQSMESISLIKESVIRISFFMRS